MKVGDLVKIDKEKVGFGWNRVGLALKLEGHQRVFVYWGSDFPFEEEYFHQLEVVNEGR